MTDIQKSIVDIQGDYKKSRAGRTFTQDDKQIKQWLDNETSMHNGGANANNTPLGPSKPACLSAGVIPNIDTNIRVEKPNIYIYSDTDREVSVYLSPESSISASIPEYMDGWRVKVRNGAIDNPQGYLFYEALIDAGAYFQKEYGWVVRQGSCEEDMAAMLEAYGFNAKETEDFLTYWCGRLEEGTDYVFHPQGNDVLEAVMSLYVVPVPENLFRLWFYITPLRSGNPPPPLPENTEKIVRGSYTVVEWGGMAE